MPATRIAFFLLYAMVKNTTERGAEGAGRGTSSVDRRQSRTGREGVSLLKMEKEEEEEAKGRAAGGEQKTRKRIGEHRYIRGIRGQEENVGRVKARECNYLLATENKLKKGKEGQR